MIVALIAAIGGVLGTSGIWTFIEKKTRMNSAHSRLLMGLAYDKIVTIGLSYIQRRWVSKDEYEEYLKYLVEPYKEMGGNGVAERIAAEVATLPFRAVSFSEIVEKGHSQNDQTQ